MSTATTTTTMQPSSDLEVNVNNEHTFFLHKNTLFSFSGRLISSFDRANRAKLKTYRVVLHDFPGGAGAFEMVCRFCYSARIDMKLSNIVMLHCAAKYLEMDDKIRAGNLFSKTERFMRDHMLFLSWGELLTMLRQCQTMLPTSDSCGLLDKFVDSIVSRMNSRFIDAGTISPVTSSPESFGFRYSSDTRSSDACLKLTKSGWWFEDLAPFSAFVIVKIVKTLISHHMDNSLIAKFLLHYLKVSVPGVSISPRKIPASSLKKQNVVVNQSLQKSVLENVVELMSLLEKGAVSCRNLFGLLRMVNMVNASTLARKQVEIMIGQQLDHATLDNLLISAAHPGCLYDVDMVVRLVPVFLRDCVAENVPQRMKKVGTLLEKYIMEVSPDANLKPSKFQELLQALPDEAYDFSDGLYRALEMYLEAHPNMSEHEELSLCSSINQHKLSFEVSKQIAQNPRFPAKVAMQVLLRQQSHLRDALSEYYTKNNLGCCPSSDAGQNSNLDKEVTASHSANLYSDYNSVLSAENKELKADLKGMQWRVAELELSCKKLHTQLSKLYILKKQKNSNAANKLPLPRLCS